VPGASQVFLGSAVTYHPSLKTRWAGVPAALIKARGVVSSEVAEAMASGARQIAESTWGLGITGVAGPGGGTAENPVGTVFIALAGEQGVESRRSFLGGDRERIRQFASYTALDMLRHRVLGLRSP
jgi:nicotinamide-nucleotide amidase